MPWAGGAAPVANPAAGGILADTGQLPAGSRGAMVIVASSVAIVVAFQWRNAGNTANIRQQVLAVPANGTATIPALQTGMEWDMNANERLRIEVLVGGNGQCSASIWHTA